MASFVASKGTRAPGRNMKHVDRTRFLFLTAALAAQGCSSDGGNEAGAGSDAADADTAVATDSGGGDSTARDSSTGDAKDASDAFDAHDSTSVTDATDATDATETSDGSDSASSSDADESGCSDLTGTPADCSTVALDCMGKCSSIRSFYKPRLAEMAIDCLMSLPTCESSVTALNCLYDALDAACPDASADAYCTSLVAGCPPSDAAPVVTMSECLEYAPGLDSAGRDRLLDLAVTTYKCAYSLKDWIPSL
jgi:hypothetical protein